MPILNKCSNFGLCEAWIVAQGHQKKGSDIKGPAKFHGSYQVHKWSAADEEAARPKPVYPQRIWGYNNNQYA